MRVVVYFGGLKQAKEMYYRGRKIKEAWYRGERVFSGKPVEVMPDMSGAYDARNWLRGKLTEYGEDYRTVQELPFEIDSSQATRMSRMFYGCSSLTTVPAMDTSQATRMDSMFYDCSSLTAVPDMNTHNVTTTASMFNGCSSLTDGNVRLIGKNQQVRTAGMIANSGLTRNPFYDSSGQPI